MIPWWQLPISSFVSDSSDDGWLLSSDAEILLPLREWVPVTLLLVLSRVPSGTTKASTFFRPVGSFVITVSKILAGSPFGSRADLSSSCLWEHLSPGNTSKLRFILSVLSLALTVIFSDFVSSVTAGWSPFCLPCKLDVIKDYTKSGPVGELELQERVILLNVDIKSWKEEIVNSKVKKKAHPGPVPSPQTVKENSKPHRNVNQSSFNYERREKKKQLFVFSKKVHHSKWLEKFVVIVTLMRPSAERKPGKEKR